MALNKRSLTNLEGVHPDLVRVVLMAAKQEQFIVTEGLRKLERQRQLVKAGKSWTLNSRHLTGHAVDLCDPDGKYDIPDMDHIRDAMFAAAKTCDVPIDWGGNWKQQDTPHFELNKKVYPASGITTRQRVQEVVTKIAVSRPVIVAAGGAAAAGADMATSPSIPAPPQAVNDALNNAGMWQKAGESIASFGDFAWQQPYIVGGILAVMALLLIGPKFLPEKWRIA